MGVLARKLLVGAAGPPPDSTNTLTISVADSGYSTVNNTTMSSASDNVTASVGDVLLLIFVSANAGTGGTALDLTLSDNASGSTNVYNQVGDIGLCSGGTPGDGTTLYIFECFVTTALASNAITPTWSGKVNSKSGIVFRLQPASGESVYREAVGTPQNAVAGTGTTTHSASTVSVPINATIFGIAAIESPNAVTADSDTTNGSWSTIQSGTGATDRFHVQYKTVTATGNQSWAITTASAQDSSCNYVIYRSVAI